MNKKDGQRNMDTLCFGGEDWWYHNRGHIDMQLMRRFARMGTTLYVNSIVMQKPKLGEGRTLVKRLVRKAKSIFAGLKKSDAGFWVYSPFSIPLHHISWLRSVNNIILRWQIGRVARSLGMHNPIVWVACPAACEIAIDMKKSRLVYQRTDRFEEYPNVDADIIKQYDRRLKANADLTIFVSGTLYDRESAQCKRAIYLDHGVDFDMFASAADGKHTPSEMREINRPIVGFFGDIEDHILDIELIEEVVDLLPEISFVFIGKVLGDYSELMRRKNVLMLGQKPYEQIANYGKCFDVAIMPWRQTRWIEVCNPVKLKEYLALGKPVVSTPFTELRKYLDVVYSATTSEEFAQCIERALAEDGPEKITARRRKVQASTWDSRAQTVLEQLFEKDRSIVEAIRE